eukprot:CAMPEP_0119113146 /NCGR_PEP_ID=MMETSP1180-20130426/42995_1 /TAXON_ID=3052 ORGANISM="Chlamydomonas cf sp, Strain CCMP681" /NCGR_SAMPLE_ID=MMETSP1180 /ASSEMBLY_ACC=CAM_ASM_000741 /LENGTH=44 /DNA_ID= /DNA_START= /DNA_END= /DNA_ORIENTATION=
MVHCSEVMETGAIQTAPYTTYHARIAATGVDSPEPQVGSAISSI